MVEADQSRHSTSGTSPLTRRRRVWKMKNYGERDDAAANRNMFTQFPFLSPKYVIGLPRQLS